MIHRLILSAPFGNYLAFPNTTPTLGTFTWQNRGGLLWRLWRIAKTVRYYPGIRAWKNKLGLPNPGIQSLPYGGDYSNSIISIAGFDEHEWRNLFFTAKGLMPAAIELNVSCPNVKNHSYKEVFDPLRDLFGATPVIVKLPPVGYEPLVKAALDASLRAFHCCNTLPTPGGGLSGKPLKPLSLEAVRRVATYLGQDKKLLIGGGGVSCAGDAMDYLEAGATHVAVGSALFFPWKWPTIKRIAADWAKAGFTS